MHDCPEDETIGFYVVEKRFKENPTSEISCVSGNTLNVELNECPNICPCLASEENVAYFMYIHGDNMVNFLNERKGKLDEKEALVYFKQMVDAISSSHDKGIAHLDIKLDNFVITDDGEILLIDFAFAHKFRNDEGAIIMATSSCGTPNYVAYEIVKNQDRKVEPYESHQADIWSLGITLYSMLTGDDYFYSPRVYIALGMVRTKKIDFTNKGLSNEAVTLLSGMVNRDVNQRWTLDQIKASSWYNKDSFDSTWSVSKFFGKKII